MSLNKLLVQSTINLKILLDALTISPKRSHQKLNLTAGCLASKIHLAMKRLKATTTTKAASIGDTNY